jgi:hypothetical protein
LDFIRLVVRGQRGEKKGLFDASRILFPTNLLKSPPIYIKKGYCGKRIGLSICKSDKKADCIDIGASEEGNESC